MRWTSPFYRHQGHLTVNGVFAPQQMDTRDPRHRAVVARPSSPSCRPRSAPGSSTAASRARTVLRKLDNPHFHRDACKRWRAIRACRAGRAILGRGVSVYFSQIFFKAPEGGGPKPAHQDNFYFGPTDIEGVVTAWIALDDATLENGCLYFGDGTNQGPVYAHFAPRGAVQPAAAAGDPRQAADDAGTGAQGRHQLSPRQHRSTSPGPTTAPSGAAPAPSTSCATTSSSRTLPLPYDHRSSSR
jgi:hypothetical protein